MIVSIDTIHDLAYERVTYISARLGADPILEFEKFDEKQFPEAHHAKELEIIYGTIDTMGQRGGRVFYFRPEGPAFALPGPSIQPLWKRIRLTSAFGCIADF